jgi:serine/threonine-protein kinase
MTQISGYKLIDKIGEGGMATVYKGIQISLNRPVAIKVLSQNVATRAEILERFNKESLIIARLNNPHIIHVIDRGITPEGMPYFVMEYVEGTDLAVAIKSGTLDANRKLELVMQICKALAYAHKNGVIHRDIKPGNVLIDTEGNARMLDFGIAQFYDDDGGAAGKTSPGVVMGTIPYMSPEQLNGVENVTALSDLYSLGVLMYELFTGIKPLGRFKPPAQVTPSIPEALEDIILNCMDPEPANRPASAEDIRDGVLKLLRGAHLATAQRERASQGIPSMENKFALLDVIKEERCGAVYLYEEKVGHTLLVIKKRPSTSAGFMEAKLLTALKHRNIVNILGASKNNAVFIIVMEYLSGGSLTDRLIKSCTLHEFLRTAREICDGLAFAHKNRILHGNLRPSNILFTDDGQAKIADFGIDEHYAGQPDAVNWYGISGEQKSPRSDIYAAGAIFHQMLTGALPPAATGAQHLLDPAVKLQPVEVQSLLSKMLVRKPDARYASFDQILADIDAISDIYAPPATRTILDPTLLLEDATRSGRNAAQKTPLPLWLMLTLLFLLILLSAAAAVFIAGTGDVSALLEFWEKIFTGRSS